MVDGQPIVDWETSPLRDGLNGHASPSRHTRQQPLPKERSNNPGDARVSMFNAQDPAQARSDQKRCQGPETAERADVFLQHNSRPPQRSLPASGWCAIIGPKFCWCAIIGPKFCWCAVIGPKFCWCAIIGPNFCWCAIIGPKFC